VPSPLPRCLVFRSVAIVIPSVDGPAGLFPTGP